MIVLQQSDQGILYPETKYSFSTKLSQLIYSLFQAFVQLIHLRFSSFKWISKNYKHLTSSPHYIFTSPPSFHAGGELDPLIEEFQKILGNKNAFSLIQSHLKGGHCHGWSLTLIQQLKGRLKEDFGASTTRLQVLEILRFYFEKAKKENLLKRVQALLPNMRKEMEFPSLEAACASKHEGLHLLRIYNDHFSHSLVLEIDSKKDLFSFTNPCSLGGTYSYQTFEHLSSALQSHIASHYSTRLKADLIQYR